MAIARHSIEDLKKRSKISDFILSTTTGKLRGSKGMALCPFHGEKTASMSFTDTENLFHCFGCKEGGDIFKYVQEINHLEFQEAIEFVAEKYGFKLSYTQTNENSDFKNFYEKINLLNDFFIESMKSSDAEKAKKYLSTRKFDLSDIEYFSISFISSDERKFQSFCNENNIDKNDLKKLGFISSNGNMLFKNRILFPILNFRNEVIAFGGRSIDDFGPKYLNSSDSVLYKKNRNLYFTKDFVSSAKRKGYVFLVEGYFDVLSLNKLGYSNSVSTSGTAFTSQQLEAISRYTEKLLICFDNDEAGLKATERVLEIKNQVSKPIEIHCLELPDDFKDIADIYENQSEIFDGILKNNFEIVDYLLTKFLNNDNNKKNVFKYFKKLSANLSPLEVDIALDLLAERLNIEKEILKRELDFNFTYEKNETDLKKTSSISIFKDIVTSQIIRNNFTYSDKEEEIINCNDDYRNYIESLRGNISAASKFDNVSYTNEQYDEAVIRLFIHFADLKIDNLIDLFEKNNEKDFSILKHVEDLKKKKEIYQNTI